MPEESTPRVIASFDPGFTTLEMARLFSAESKVAAMARVEAALAGAQADLGIIPTAVAEEIQMACAEPITDPGAILVDGWEAGSPVIPLLSVLRGRLGATAGRWVHHGATTQDIVDTALMLVVRDGLDVLERNLAGCADDLTRLAVDHRDTPMTARTLLQSAGQTTFGVRVVQWLEPLARHTASLHTRASSLPVQLGGPIGIADAFPDGGVDLVAKLAENLGLAAPVLAWHTERSRLGEVVGLVDSVAAWVGKVGLDLVLLAQSGIGEVRMRPGGSTSVADKRNPIDAVRAVAASAACSANVSLVTGGRPHELERAAGGWHTEWFAVPVAFQTGGAAVEAISRAIGSIEVDADRMLSNLNSPVDPTALRSATLLVDRVVAHVDTSMHPPP